MMKTYSKFSSSCATDPMNYYTFRLLYISWYTSIVSLSYDIFIQTGFSATFSKEEFSPKQCLRKAKII